MAGWVTNGLPLVSAPTLNSVVQVSPNGVYTTPTGRELLSVDTETSAGASPQSVAMFAFQVAAAAAALAVPANQATSTTHAATLNTTSGLIITESLTTAVAATYTFTLTNSLISTANTPPSPTPIVVVNNGSNTGGQLVLTSVTNGAGNSVFVFTNVGTTALNGTLNIAFHI